MARKRQKSSPPSSPPAGEQDAPEQQAQEGYGPVLVSRHVKEDGRALILYAHAPEPRP